MTNMGASWILAIAYLVAYYGWIVAIPIGIAMYPKIQAKTGASKWGAIARGIGVSLLVYFIGGAVLMAIIMLLFVR